VEITNGTKRVVLIIDKSSEEYVWSNIIIKFDMRIGLRRIFIVMTSGVNGRKMLLAYKY